MRIIRRRTALGAALGTGLASFAGRRVGAQSPPEVKVALLTPISGPWARQGVLMRMGGEMAVDEINAAGGIRALGGAKLRLLVFDAGDSTEKAKNAAQRMVAQEPDLVGGTGAWLSSFTLAVTEVTERAELPWLTFSYSDLITARGFRNVFQTSMTADRMAQSALPTIVAMAERATGKRPARVGIVADNTASNVSFLRPIRESALKDLGLTAVVDEIYTPPLSDATTLVQRVRSARPQFLIFLPTTIPDTKLVLDKCAEFGLPVSKLPTVANATHVGAPELRDQIGWDALEGMMSLEANWPGKQHAALIERFRARTGEAWMTQDALGTYGDMWVFKEALERAGAADRRRVADAIRGFDLRDGPALYYTGGHLKFDDKGRRVDAALAIIQWQDHKAVLVYPEDVAVARPAWPAA